MTNVCKHFNKIIKMIKVKIILVVLILIQVKNNNNFNYKIKKLYKKSNKCLKTSKKEIFLLNR